MEIGAQCEACFQQYCWDGTINTTTSLYNPTLKSDNATFTTAGQAGSSPPPSKSGGTRRSVAISGWGILVASFVFVLL
jgi:hypothetical protein